MSLILDQYGSPIFDQYGSPIYDQYGEGGEMASDLISIIFQAFESKAREEGSYWVDVSYLDIDGSAIVPTAVTWGLRALDGTVINSLSDQSISVPATTNRILLDGDDLQIIGSDDADEGRVLTVEATFNSDLGSGLPQTNEFRFIVQNLIGVS